MNIICFVWGHGYKLDDPEYYGVASCPRCGALMEYYNEDIEIPKSLWIKTIPFNVKVKIKNLLGINNVDIPF